MRHLHHQHHLQDLMAKLSLRHRLRLRLHHHPKGHRLRSQNPPPRPALYMIERGPDWLKDKVLRDTGWVSTTMLFRE